MGGQHGVRLADARVQLEVRPLSDERMLARQTGHCDLDGVVASHGSQRLARRACHRDQEVEHDLADGLRLSSAADLHNTGRERHLAGQTDQARVDYDEAIRRDNHGRTASSVTTLARINLGLLDHEQGDHASSMAHLEWVLEHSDDPAVRGAAYHNLSLGLLEQGEMDRALEASQQGHRLLSQALGEAHGSVGAALNARGVIHAERDELDQAVEILERAIDVRVVALGELHPATAASYTNLGVALGRRGEWDAALVAHREALSVDQQVLGPRHATTAADHAHVGVALLELGHPKQARESFREAQAILVAIRAEDDPERQRLRAWLKRSDEEGRVARD